MHASVGIRIAMRKTCVRFTAPMMVFTLKRGSFLAIFCGGIDPHNTFALARINAPHLRDLALEVEAKTRLYQKVSFAFVSREHPIIARADELVNEELDKAVGPGSRVR